MLREMYNKEDIILPSCKSLAFSMLNAEKVVNPPQIPVARNVFQLLLMNEYLMLSPTNKPINKLPLIFIKKVTIKAWLVLKI